MWRNFFTRITRRKQNVFRRRVLPEKSTKKAFVNPYFVKKKPFLIVTILRSHYQVLIGTIVGCVAIYIFFFSSFFRIQTVSVEGAKSIDPNTLKSRILDVIDKKSWIFFPQSNLLVFRSKSAYNDLSKDFAFEELYIQKKYPHTLLVKIKERVSSFTYINNNVVYILDLQGEITQIPPRDQVNAHYPKVIDQNNRSLSIRDKVLSDSMIRAISYLQKKIPESLSQEIDYYSIPKIRCMETATIEKEISVPVEEGNGHTQKNQNSKINANSQTYIMKTEITNAEKEVPCNYIGVMSDGELHFKSKWYMIFDSLNDVSDQVAALQVSLVKEVQGSPKEYIDVRIPSRVFYK